MEAVAQSSNLPASRQNIFTGFRYMESLSNVNAAVILNSRGILVTQIKTSEIHRASVCAITMTSC